jgi:hypothetical protein
MYAKVCKRWEVDVVGREQGWVAFEPSSNDFSSAVTRATRRAEPWRWGRSTMPEPSEAKAGLRALMMPEGTAVADVAVRMA